jgi:hypothetical protein
MSSVFALENTPYLKAKPVLKGKEAEKYLIILNKINN